MVAVASLGRKGQLTIPAEVRQEAGLQPGNVFTIEVTDQGIVLRPMKIDPEQAWFWTPEWQAKEREADKARLRAASRSVLLRRGVLGLD